MFLFLSLSAVVVIIIFSFLFHLDYVILLMCVLYTAESTYSLTTYLLIWDDWRKTIKLRTENGKTCGTEWDENRNITIHTYNWLVICFRKINYFFSFYRLKLVQTVAKVNIWVCNLLIIFRVFIYTYFPLNELHIHRAKV